MSRALLLAIPLAAAAAIAACQPPGPDAMGPRLAGTTAAPMSNAPSTIDAPEIPPDAFVTLKSPADAHAELCTNDGAHPSFPNDADLLTKVFCQDLVAGHVMPTPKSLDDFLGLLGLSFANRKTGNGVGGNPGFAILGHSSALTARRVSSITPTTFIFPPPPADGSAIKTAYAIVAFDPGEPFVEVASYDPTADTMNFYIVLMDHACTSTAAGCTPTDMLTPAIASGWSNVRIYEDTTSLGNTIFDCHVCHQPDASKAPILRMQEIAAPFTHWMSATTEGGKALLDDFHAAHGTSEDYGGVPAALLDASDPSKLAALVTQAGFGAQPNAFPSAAIETEVKTNCPTQPATNMPPGASSTWLGLYANAVAGTMIAPPYHDVKVTDPDKLAAMTNAYQLWMGKQAGAIPDVRDVMLDEGLRDMGFAPKLGASGRELLQQMCEECHDANLDMTQSREKFLVDQLDAMSRDEKNTAIDRLRMDTSTRLRMPPPLFRTITDDERQLMIEELSK